MEVTHVAPVSMLVYDIEIHKAIPDRARPPVDGIQYCGGWGDHAGMGIAVIGVYDYLEQRSRVFCADNLEDFFAIAGAREHLVSFNGIGFDNKVLDCARPGWAAEVEPRCWDLLQKVWLAAGLGPKWAGGAYAGFGLDAMCGANLHTGKSGNGALAPINWQQAKYGSVIDYCLHDVHLTRRLMEHATNNLLTNPKTGAKLLPIQTPLST